MLKIWGRPEAIGAQRVLWSCEELRLPFRRFDPDHAGATRASGLLVDEPVPMVDERGLTMWESNALMRYLFGQFGPRIPRAQRTACDRWVDWTASYLVPSLRAFHASALRARGDGADESILRKGRECAELAAKLDEALTASPFLCGDELTMADVAAGSAVWHWFVMGAERPHLPLLGLWVERLRLRTGFERHVIKPLAQHKAVAAAQAARGRRPARTLASAS